MAAKLGSPAALGTGPAAFRGVRPASQLDRSGRRGIATPGSVHEMDMVAARRRGHEAGHERGALPVDPDPGDPVPLGRRQQGLETIREGRSAIQGHPQGIVEFPEIGVSTS